MYVIVRAKVFFGKYFTLLKEGVYVYVCVCGYSCMQCVWALLLVQWFDAFKHIFKSERNLFTDWMLHSPYDAYLI